jgi:hypothetical protein
MLSLSKHGGRASARVLRQVQDDRPPRQSSSHLALVCNERLIWPGGCIAACVINASPSYALVTNEREIKILKAFKALSFGEGGVRLIATLAMTWLYLQKYKHR